MPKQTNSIARHKNNVAMTPDRFHSDMVRLAHQSPSDAAEVANTWRQRFLNAAEATQQGTEAALEFGTTAFSSFGMGLLDGALNAKKAHLTEKWESGGRNTAIAKMKEANVQVPADTSTLRFHDVARKFGGGMDPTALFGIPYTLLGTLLLGGLAVFRVGEASGVHKYIKAAAAGGAAYWTGMLGYNLTFDSRIKALSNTSKNGEAASA
jgi:hypothetical protein